MPVIDVKATGLNIKTKLKEKGITITKLQNALGFRNPQAIYKWLRGENLPTIDNLILIAFILNITMDELVIIHMI